MSHLLRLCFALLVGQIRHFVYVPDYGCHIRVGVHQATKERSCILWQVEPGQRSNHAPLQAMETNQRRKGLPSGLANRQRSCSAERRCTRQEAPLPGTQR